MILQTMFGIGIFFFLFENLFNVRKFILILMGIFYKEKRKIMKIKLDDSHHERLTLR